MTSRRGIDPAPPFRRSRWFLGFLLFAVVSVYMLFTEHRAHFLSALPLVLLLTCTVAHVLMHREHAVDGSQSRRDPPETHRGDHA